MKIVINDRSDIQFEKKRDRICLTISERDIYLIELDAENAVKYLDTDKLLEEIGETEAIRYFGIIVEVK